MWWLWLIIGFVCGVLGMALFVRIGCRSMLCGTLTLSDPLELRIMNAGPFNRKLKFVAVRVKYNDYSERKFK